MQEKLLTREDADVGQGLFDSIAWVIEKIGLPPHPLQDQWRSAVLHCVNEDSPQKVEFYLQGNPTIHDIPAYTWLPYHTCQACEKRGWILVVNPEHGLGIEKCPACERFKRDSQAVTYAAAIASGQSETDAVIAVYRLSNNPKPDEFTIDVLVKVSISVGLTYDHRLPDVKQIRFDALQNFLDHPALKDIATLEQFVDDMEDQFGHIDLNFNGRASES